MNNEQEIVKILKRMDARLSVLEGGKPAQPEPQLTATEQVLQGVKKALETREWVRLTEFGTGFKVAFAKRELSKDRNLGMIVEDGRTYVYKKTQQRFIKVGAEIQPTEKYISSGTTTDRVKGRIGLILAELDKGKTLAVADIMQMFNCPRTTCHHYFDKIGKMAGYKLSRFGERQEKILNKVGDVSSSEVAPEPKREARNGKTSYQDKVDMVQAEVDRGKTLTSRQIKKMLHISWGYASQMIDSFVSKPGYKVVRIGVRKVLSRSDTEPKQEQSFRKGKSIFDWQEFLVRIRRKVEEGHSLMKEDLVMMGMPMYQNSTTHIFKLLEKQDWCTIDRTKPHQRVILPADGVVSMPSKFKSRKGTKHPERITAYNRFMGEKIRYYMTQDNMGNEDAFRCATADWNKSKGVIHPESIAVVQFPALQSIKAELQPIAESLLKRSAQSGLAITYNDVAYTLDFQNSDEFLEFGKEIIEKSGRIGDAINLRGKFIWDGTKLRWQG